MIRLRQMPANDPPYLGLCVCYPLPGVVERIGSDWDWLWVDGQHGELDEAALLSIVRACDLIQRPAIVRVPWHEVGPIARVLDMGAAGVIVPCVDSPEEAKAAVRAAKFPPLGRRSFGGRRVIDRQSRRYVETANDDVLLFVMIESPEAMDQVEAIAATPGVDGLFLGPDDIMLRRGYSMDTPRTAETLGGDLERMARACHDHGKLAMGVGVMDEPMRLCRDLGYHFIVGATDVYMLAEASKTQAGHARAMMAGAASTQLTASQ